MITVDVRVTGIDGIGEDFIRVTRPIARSALSKTSTVLARQMRNNLSKRGGPSLPGQPPARDEGHLRSTVGKDRPKRDGDTMFVDVGIGVGRAKVRKATELKGRGINVFQIGNLHELGGLGAGGRRYPPRSFARLAEEQTRAEIEAMLDAALR